MKKRRVAIIVGIVAALAAAAFLAPRALEKHRRAERQRYRREWKDRAVAEIRRLANDPDWVAAEMAALKSQPPKSLYGGEGWLSERLVLLENGDWMVYAAKARKEDQRIDDIFICKASDGKWYYSTYHFCKMMTVLTWRGQRPDLASVIEAYYLEEFDGKSDEALGKTWPE